MSRVGETTGEAAPGAAPPQAEDTASANYLIVSLLRMQAENTREALSVAEETLTGTLASPGDPSVTTQNSDMVVASRQNIFLQAMWLIFGVRGYDVDHERGLNCLRDARDRGCAAAMAVLCADHPGDGVKQTCFDVLRVVSLSVAGGFYNHVMTVVCKVLCARMCELQLAKPSKYYDYLDEYKQASLAGCQFSSVLCAAELERNGHFSDAVCLYASAVEGGYATALYHTARCHRHGIGVEQNFDEAMKIMKQSSDKKFLWAMLDRAVMLINAEDPTTRARDDEEAFNLLQQVAAGVKHAYEHKGPMRCLYLQFRSVPNPHKLLALCYKQGRGVAQNSAAAQRQEALFDSANQGN